MKRRDFLKILGVGVAAVVGVGNVDIEKLIDSNIAVNPVSDKAWTLTTWIKDSNTINQLRIFNRELTDTEILSLYNEYTEFKRSIIPKDD